MKIFKSIIVLAIPLTFACCDSGSDSWPAMQAAIDALVSDSTVTVTKVENVPADSNYYYEFKPTRDNQTTAFIFYPGGLVEPEAYAPPLKAIAASGYLTILVKMPRDLAVFGFSRADKIMSSGNYPEIEKWVIGGHSMGGSFACAYAVDNTDKLDGVILWASWPSESFNLADTTLEAISIYGDKDGHPDEIEAGAEHLPEGTPFVKIEGGNHTQFGYYDTSPYDQQPEDGVATITREEQQAQIIDATVSFLEGL